MRLYSLGIVWGALVLFGCQGYNSYDYLDGKFITKDISQVDLIAPTDRATSSKSPKFVWSKRSGAGKYLLEVSTISTFSTTVLSQTVTESSYTLVNNDLSGMSALDASSYYWRVTAIYTDQKVVSGSFVFHVLDDYIVYVNGSSTATDQVGNKGAPYKTVQAGIEAANNRRSGVLATVMDVYVASGAYTEEVSLRPGISIRGGFEGSGWTRNVNNNLATISAPTDVAVRGNSAITSTYTATTVVDGLVIQGRGTTNFTGYGIYLSDASPLIINNSINGGVFGANSTVGIYSVGINAAPRILNNLISGGAGGNAYGFQGGTGSAIISNNTINAGTTSGLNRTGIWFNGNNYTITNNIVLSTGTGGTCNGVVENMGTTNPRSFQNNLVFDCATLYYDDNATPRTTEAELAIPANTTEGTVASTAGNLGPTTIANFAAMNFAGASNFHLTGTTPLAVTQGGKDTSQSTCGSAGTSSCGNVTSDRDGKLRTAPYSIGAYEY